MDLFVINMIASNLLCYFCNVSIVQILLYVRTIRTRWVLITVYGMALCTLAARLALQHISSFPEATTMELLP